MKKTIVIVSNPFGYGPTGKAIALAEAFQKLANVNVVFVGNSFAQEILPSNLSYISANERSEERLVTVFRGLTNPFIVSSQNRFAIYAAKKLGLPCAFLDGLAWFWKDIPSDHFIADYIFWMRYPGREKKPQSNSQNIFLVPAIVDIETTEPAIDSRILLHVGGCENPLTKALPVAYLDLLGAVLNDLEDISKQKTMLTGGMRALEHLKLRGLKGIKMKTLKHDDFIAELKKADHFITTAGQTASLEAFALGIPTSFLLPTNLSQLAFTDMLTEFGATVNQLEWVSYVSPINFQKIRDLTEKEALYELTRYAEGILNNNNKLERYKEDFHALFHTHPSSVAQQEFIKTIGVNGAEKIVEILDKGWRLSQEE